MRGRINRTKGNRTKRMTHTCHNRNERSQTFKDVWRMKSSTVPCGSYRQPIPLRMQKDLQMDLINEVNEV
jgi:hypothetical protein